MQNYFVYILKSQKDKGYYVGMTSDILKRLGYHNSGHVRSTKHRTPFGIVYSESYSTRTEAREREKYLKSYKGSKEKLSILEKI
jgi:putative endonuclease